MMKIFMPIFFTSNIILYTANTWHTFDMNKNIVKWKFLIQKFHERNWCELWYVGTYMMMMMMLLVEISVFFLPRAVFFTASIVQVLVLTLRVAVLPCSSMAPISPYFPSDRGRSLMSLQSRPRPPSSPPLSCLRVLAVGTSSRVSQCRFAGSVRSSIMSKISSFSADTIILQCSSSMKLHPPGRGQYKSYFCTNILFGLMNNFFRLRVTSTNVYIHTHTHTRTVVLHFVETQLQRLVSLSTCLPRAVMWFGIATVYRSMLHTVSLCQDL